MNGQSRNRNYVRHENLRLVHSLRFIGLGLGLAFKKLFILPFLLINLLGVVLILQIQSEAVLGGVYAFLWRALATLLLLSLDIVVLYMLGAPKGFIAIMRRLERVPDLRNGDREPPILWDRVILDSVSHVERWTFKSFGIGFEEWADPTRQQQIENALDICVLGVEYGKDNTLTILKVLNHPGPWPTVIPWDKKYLPQKNSQICVGLNRSYPVSVDLAVHPHYMIGGETGSGKTVLIKSIISQALLKGYDVYLVDMKHFVDYVDTLPYLTRSVDDENDLTGLLAEMVSEMHQRLTYLKDCGCANIEKYNESHPEAPMQRILCVIDEYMEAIVKTGRKEQKARGEKNEEYIASLCKLARAAGVSMILGLQRGGQEISGQIRSNVRVILGSCNDNLSIVMTGSAELGRMIPPDSVGMFITDNRQLFKAFYCGFDY